MPTPKTLYSLAFSTGVIWVDHQPGAGGGNIYTAYESLEEAMFHAISVYHTHPSLMVIGRDDYMSNLLDSIKAARDGRNGQSTYHICGMLDTQNKEVLQTIATSGMRPIHSYPVSSVADRMMGLLRDRHPNSNIWVEVEDN